MVELSVKLKYVVLEYKVKELQAELGRHGLVLSGLQLGCLVANGWQDGNLLDVGPVQEDHHSLVLVLLHQLPGSFT